MRGSQHPSLACMSASLSETALTATRREDPQDGSNATYVYGCVCSGCGAQQRNAGQCGSAMENNSGRVVGTGSFGPWIRTVVLFWASSSEGDIDRSSLSNDRKVRVMTAGNNAIVEDHLILMERLSAQDLMNLWPDEFGWPMDLGALAILDGTQLIDP